MIVARGMLAAPTRAEPIVRPSHARPTAGIPTANRAIEGTERRVICDTYRRSDNLPPTAHRRTLMNRTHVALVLSAVLFAAPALAREHNGWVYDGLTGGGRISESGLSDDVLASNSSLGYRWGTIGFEVGHVYFGTFEDSSTFGGTTVNVDSHIDGWNVGLNATHDINEKWSMQGRIGVFNWNADGHVASGASAVRFSDSGNDWYAGASIDHKWRKRSEIGFGYTYFKVNDTSIGLWGMHSEYRFGSD
jgi:hypothetical protein